MNIKHYAAMGVLAFGIIAPATASANDERIEKFKGTWKVANAGASNKAIKRAVKAGAETANFFIRGIAEGRLTDSTRLCNTMIFDYQGDNLNISCKRKNAPFTHKLKAKGTKKNVEKKWDVTTSYPPSSKAKLKQTYQVRGEDNKRVNTYVINDDGSMTMHVRIVSTSLGKDVTYKVKYVR